MDKSYDMINESDGPSSSASATPTRTFPEDSEFMIPILSASFDDGENVQLIHHNEENPNVQVATRGMKQIVEGVQELVNSVPQQDLNDTNKERLRDGLLKIASGLSDTVLGMEFLAAEEEQEGQAPVSEKSSPAEEKTKYVPDALPEVDSILQNALEINSGVGHPWWFNPTNLMCSSLLLLSIVSVVGSTCIFWLGVVACSLCFL